MATEGVENIQDVSSKHVRAFLLSLQERFRPKTVHGIATDLRAFFRFHEAEGNLERNPMARVPMPKLDKTILPAYTSTEVELLLKATSGRDQLAIRNRALILVLLDSGVRVSELAAMKVGDVDSKNGTFKVLGKGSKERMCRVSAPTLKALHKYSRMRRGKTGDPLWIGTRGALTRNGIGEILDGIGKGVGVHAHPHKFRRTCAITMLRAGADLFSVQRLLGHSDLTVLRRYLDQTEADDFSVHERASPVMHLI